MAVDVVAVTVYQIEFLDYGGVPIPPNQPMSTTDPEVFQLLTHYNDPPDSGSSQAVENEGSSSAGGPGIVLPGEPSEESFTLRITDAAQSLNSFSVTLSSESTSIVVPMSRVGTSPVFLSDADIYAIEGDALTAAEKALFPFSLFIDPKSLSVTYKSTDRGRVTARAFIVHRTKAHGGTFTQLSDASQPGAVAHDTSVELYTVVRVKERQTGATKYYLGSPGDTVPTSADVDGGVRTLGKWPAGLGAITFSWQEVQPKYTDYSNKKTGQQWKYDTSHDYREIATGGTGWKYVVPLAKIGVSRWTVDAEVNGRTFGPPGKSKRRGPPGDNGISDQVKRIVRKGNYSNAYLQWAGSFIGTAWTYASHMSQQVDKYIGTDCADLCIGAYRKAGVGTYGNESANSIVGKARNAANTDFSVVAGLDGKKLADGVSRNLLKPGDLIVLRKAGEAVFHHAVIYIGEKQAGALDGTEQIIMANWARGADSSKFYRVTVVKLSAVLGASVPPAAYDRFTVVRLSFP